ncbi:MAG: NAD-dependent epimerase/dehydratase family protein [Candidatus Altiarchaeota archaeon]
MKKILITGSMGQIGSELAPELRQKYGRDNVIASGRRPSESLSKEGLYEIIDATDKNKLKDVIDRYDIDTIYHLVGILSAKGEENPDVAWDINMNSLKNALDLARDMKLKIFWASSIAAFGPNTPQYNTPQLTIMDPNTMYGVTKYAGELLCNYYFKKYGVDVRSLRYPGILSYKTPPGGGTTDYAVAIFYEAIQNKRYTCFLREDSTLPMMYMPDAIKATIDIMEAPAEKIKTRFSYNLAAISFAPKELATEIRKHMPEFKCDYKPDHRQKIADSWPKTIDDSQARKDWGWKHKYGLKEMTEDMLENLKKKIGG